jgi:hypothetical protein
MSAGPGIAPVIENQIKIIFGLKLDRRPPARSMWLRINWGY